jgi:hypothetical protein
MQLLSPDYGLIVWTILLIVAAIFMATALVHLLFYKKAGSKELLLWLLAIILIPVFGPLIYFKSLRQTKQIH